MEVTRKRYSIPHVNIHLIDVQTGEERHLVPDSDVGHLVSCLGAQCLDGGFFIQSKRQPRDLGD